MVKGLVGCMRRRCALFALAGSDAWSQARTIRIVVPFPAGGSADILARLLGEHIAKNQGPSVVVENRPGGGASIAYEAVARAAPDGNTLVINGNSIVINPHLRKVNYDPLTSFEPVCYLLSFAAGLRRERGLALQDAGRLRRRHQGAGRHAGVRDRRPRDHAAHRLRAVPGDVEDRRHLRALSRRRAGDDGAARRPRAGGADELFGGGGAVARRHRPRARVGVAEAHSAAAGRADGR